MTNLFTADSGLPLWHSCPQCLEPWLPVEVHGHQQCGACGWNSPCCEGSERDQAAARTVYGE